MTRVLFYIRGYVSNHQPTVDLIKFVIISLLVVGL